MLTADVWSASPYAAPDRPPLKPPGLTQGPGELVDVVRRSHAVGRAAVEKHAPGATPESGARGLALAADEPADLVAGALDPLAASMVG